MIPSIPYPDDSYLPFWGPVTAPDNFCERDYIFSPYIAEFANTLTNIAYIIYSVHGLRNLHLGHRLTWTSALPLVGLMAVGICSGAFHMTLREIPQRADEMSMVFPTVFVLLRLLTFEMQGSKHAGPVIAAVTVALLTVYTIHMNINQSILHTLTFGVMVHFIRKKTWRLLSEQVPNSRIRNNLRRTALFGSFSFGLGFLLWLVDRFACSSLTRAKQAIGMPYGLALELHGWWHVLTAIGAYVFIVLVDYLTSGQTGKSHEDAFGWPAKQILRSYAERQQPLANGSKSSKSREAKAH